MPRIKEKQKIIHEPSTHELFLCLGEMPSYSKILLENNSDKPYSKFLQWLLEINFYKRGRNEWSGMKDIISCPNAGRRRKKYDKLRSKAKHLEGFIVISIPCLNNFFMLITIKVWRIFFYRRLTEWDLIPIININ